MTDADSLEPAAAEPGYSPDYTNDAATFGDRIVAAREAMGMTAPQLARRLGIKTQTLQNWEEDRSEPRANKLQILAGVLNVSIIWLMSGQGVGLRSAAGPMSEAEIDDLIDELRGIREAHGELTARMLRLERRLLSLHR